MRKTILYGIIIFQIVLIISLIRGIQSSRRSSVRIAELEQTKSKLEDERRKLKNEEEYVQSPYYLEKVARDELHLSKSGEKVVIIPSPKIVENKESGQKDMERDKANWMKWWDVLSGTQ